MQHRIYSWEANCAANNETNGVDLRQGVRGSGIGKRSLGNSGRKLARAAIRDVAPKNAVGLPSPFLPTLPPAAGSTGVIKSFVLPGNETGVVRACNDLSAVGIDYHQMFVGSFEGDFNQFQTDTVAAIQQFKASGVTRLLIDLTNNGGMSMTIRRLLKHRQICTGGFVCLGHFLHQYLAGMCTTCDTWS